MIIFISDVLNQDALSRAREAAAGLSFEPGQTTAGWHARSVKANSQAMPSAGLRVLQQRIVKAIEAHPVVQMSALPRLMTPPLISRYGPGDAYGRHVDDAVMGTPPMRSDLSATLFLNDPDAYDGGELIIEGPGGEEAIKLAAGSLVLYPSTSLHQVAPVTKGERLVAVTWIQSLVADEAARAILFDLAQAKQQMFEQAGKSPAFDLLAKSYANLLRRWARP
ncbi:PKHD-type hydroxylase [Iodidimonas muriae]|uniref:PKHD-type hydroxylase n=1 Tax=Iodidimonas muriae TaxID=261467 RepID=A0ABQ2LCI6_9PROT|nr:Fe2+-dependent dioxygenase [Iodidimonas muriae]GER07435.1 PKHD-type hydroxylase [Kordiimonadales bacterium JCM 17843]GGO10521.1 PKHD-type hydroxylase [Iodidimonas muriae]